MTEGIRIPELRTLSGGQLRSSLTAVDEIRECYRVLKKGGLNIVGEVLRDQGPFYEMDHYPKDDVYDRETASQYYYHAHREDHEEHGHFHLFVRNSALPESAEPVHGPVGEDRVAHLVAISMDAWGYPTDLFAVNRWVTDESWPTAEAVIADRLGQPLEQVLEDRTLEITGSIAIEVESWAARLKTEQSRRSKNDQSFLRAASASATR